MKIWYLTNDSLVIKPTHPGIWNKDGQVCASNEGPRHVVVTRQINVLQMICKNVMLIRCICQYLPAGQIFNTNRLLSIGFSTGDLNPNMIAVYYIIEELFVSGHPFDACNYNSTSFTGLIFLSHNFDECLRAMNH